MQTITAGYPTQIMAVDLMGPLTESKSGNRYNGGRGLFFLMDGSHTCTKSRGYNRS